MTGNEFNLNGEVVSRKEELFFVYDGPSFNGKMEMPSLINQLESTEFLIREVIDNLYSEKKVADPKNIKLYLKLKKGSFQEIIEIVLNHPMSVGIISGCIVLIFGRLLEKRGKPNCLINVEKLTNNITIVKEIDNIFLPLQRDGDKLTVYSPSKKKVKTEINYSDKDVLKRVLKKLEEETSVEIYEEDFFGYLYLINIDKDKFGFTLEGSNKHVPISFIKQVSLDELRKMIGEKIKIKANATYRNKEIIKLEIIEYHIKQRKSLQDFS
jgi:hypothetical protein